MAFPTTPVLDNFNSGANQSLRAGRAGWDTTQLGGATTWTTDAVPTSAVSSGVGGCWWPVVANDYECFFKLANWTPSAATIVAAARITTAGVTQTCYGLVLANSAATDCQLAKFVGGTKTMLGSNVPTTVASGDSMGIECVGTTINGYIKIGAGAWTLTCTVTDASVSAPGIGIGFFTLFGAANQTIDDFGGTAAAAVPQRPNLQVVRRTWTGR